MKYSLETKNHIVAFSKYIKNSISGKNVFQTSVKSYSLLSHMPTRGIKVGLRTPTSPYRENEFDRRWARLNEDEKKDLASEYESFQSKDWKTLSSDQKRALYTIAYGLPEVKNPNEKYYVLFGVIVVISLGTLTFAGIRSLAGAPSSTYTDEWYEESKKLMRKQKADPIDKSFED